jgi:uncharacterized protein (DUF1778 family)
MEKKRIMLYVDEDKYNLIKQEADKDDRSMNNFILKIIDKHLKERAASE